MNGLIPGIINSEPNTLSLQWSLSGKSGMGPPCKGRLAFHKTALSERGDAGLRARVSLVSLGERTVLVRTAVPPRVSALCSCAHRATQGARRKPLGADTQGPAGLATRLGGGGAGGRRFHLHEVLYARNPSGSPYKLRNDSRDRRQIPKEQPPLCFSCYSLHPAPVTERCRLIGGAGAHPRGPRASRCRQGAH